MKSMKTRSSPRQRGTDLASGFLIMEAKYDNENPPMELSRGSVGTLGGGGHTQVKHTHKCMHTSTPHTYMYTHMVSTSM